MMTLKDAPVSTAIILTTLVGVLSAVGGGTLALIVGKIFRGKSDKIRDAVSERDANTRQMDVIFKGLTDTISSIQNSLDLTQKDLAGTKEELRSTRSELRTLENRVTVLNNERTEMLMHIGKLEALVPVPPGPPLRPAWGIAPEPA